ncbi:major facilitator superfamily domain-containing protein [Lentinula raphanica]|nr:major facilitator superfamily domain-containing protein [Lentinula raphanica]
MTCNQHFPSSTICRPCRSGSSYSGTSSSAWRPKLPIFDSNVSLGLAMFLYAIEETIVATSVASIGAALDIKSSLTWISTSYFLTTTVVQPIIGRIADVVGSKRLLLIELWIFALGNIIAGTSKSLTQIIVGRLISGIGGAGLMSVVCILVSQLTHERQRATYMNLINAVFIVSDALGPILGGALAKSGNWRWIFLLNAPFSPVITFLILRWLRYPSPTLSSAAHIRSMHDVLAKVDLLGMFTLVSCLSFLVVALNSGGQTAPWGSSLIVGMLCALGVSGIAFCVVEGKYAKMPIAPGRLFVRWDWRNVPIMMVNRTLLFFHNFAMIFYIPIFLQVIGLPTVTASALIIPFLAMAAISSTIVNATASRYGYVRLICFCGIAVIPIGMGLMSTLNEKSSIGRIVGYSLISGLGFGSPTL